MLDVLSLCCVAGPQQYKHLKGNCTIALARLSDLENQRSDTKAVSGYSIGHQSGALTPVKDSPFKTGSHPGRLAVCSATLALESNVFSLFDLLGGAQDLLLARSLRIQEPSSSGLIKRAVIEFWSVSFVQIAHERFNVLKIPFSEMTLMLLDADASISPSSRSLQVRST
jgi:hypothetical protein